MKTEFKLKNGMAKTIEKELERRKKLSIAMTGRKIQSTLGEKNPSKRLEVRKKMSENHRSKRGFPHPMYGKHHSEESKKKMSKSTKGKHNSSSTEFKKGKHYSRKTEFKKGDKRTKEIRARLVSPKKDTSIEVKIQNFLKQLSIEYFTHQYIKEIKHRYQCDILIPSMNLVIECDGDFFHCNPSKYSPDFVRFPNSKSNQPACVIWERDRIRTKELIEKGFKVLRLWEHEIKVMELNDFSNKLKSVTL